MRGKKELVWAVVISAAFITAGLILSCGDDNGGNGEPDATWEDFCEKIIDCGLLDEEELEECEAWGEELEGGYDYDVDDLTNLLNCTVDAHCAHMGMDCWCKVYSEKLIDCEMGEEEELIFYLAQCGYNFVFGSLDGIVEQTICFLANSCDDIVAECLE